MEKSRITTIKITKNTKERLNKFKEHPKESYEEVLKKILFILNTFRKNPEKAKNILRKLDLSIKRKQIFSKK